MRTLPLLVLVLGTSITPLLAQEENPWLREVEEEETEEEQEEESHPYYASFGLGAAAIGVASNYAPQFYSPNRTVPALSLAVGGLVAPQLGVELDLFGWFNFTGNGTVETVTTFMVGGRLHPIPGAGLYLRAGAGFGAYVLQWEDSWWQNWFDDGCDCNDAIDTDIGLAWSVGAGYDARISRGLRLGPFVELIRMNVSGPAGYRQRMLNIGLTLTFDGHL